jgi:hypothetical protein
MQAEKQCNYRRCFKKFTNLIARERTHTERPSHKLRLKICVVFFLPAQNSKEKERKDFLYGETPSQNGKPIKCEPRQNFHSL